MQELLLSIWELHKKTVLFVTHDIDEAIFMANRCAVFSARPGRIKNELGIDLPPPGHYAVAMCFLPRDEATRAAAQIAASLRALMPVVDGIAAELEGGRLTDDVAIAVVKRVPVRLLVA